MIIFRANQTNSWTTDLSVEGKQYDRVLYFAMTDLNHMDLMINCDSKHYEEESGSDDSSIILTKLVPATGEIDGDDDLMIIGISNCVDQEYSLKFKKTCRIHPLIILNTLLKMTNMSFRRGIMCHNAKSWKGLCVG